MSRKSNGFTLTELMLAMGGLSFLFLFVVFAIFHVTGLYTKGMAIREINQAGRQISEEIMREIRFGSEVRVPDPTKNRLCVGDRSYIWSNNMYTNNFDPVDGGGLPVRFVVSRNTSYCTDVDKKVKQSEAEDLLPATIKLQEFSIVQPQVAAPIYNIRMVFSTATTGNEPTATDLGGGVWSYECSPTTGQFCAFGEFENTVYARNK